MKKKSFQLMILAALLAGAGCAAQQQGGGEARIPSPYSLPVRAEVKEPPKEGAIFSENFDNLYGDNRAHRVGDILLVQIVENSSGSKKASTKTERQSTISGGIANLFGIETWLANKNANFTPSLSNLEAELQNDFDGSGETRRDSKVTATISARVVDKTMDGNLVIRGYREIRVNNETQHIILSGLVRPDDVRADNSVLSSHVADARIDYGGVGILAEKQQPGWLSRGLEVLWPF